MPDRTSHLLLFLLVAAFASLGIHSLVQKSVTIDEYGFLPAAWNLVSTGDLRFSEWHTPLVNGLLGLPLLGADVLPFAPPDGTPVEGRYWFWNNGEWFAEANGDRYHALLVRARLVNVLLGMALGVLAYLFARQVAGPRAGGAGLVAAALTLFHPEVLAHTRLVTLDVGLALFFTLSLFTLHRYLKAPGLRRAAWAGAALGLALASKFTSLVLIPVILVTVGLLARRSSGSDRIGRTRWTSLGHLALLGLVALLVLQSSYLFQEPTTGRASVSARSAQMKSWQQHWPDWARIPVPAQFVRAVDHQLADQDRRYQGYLNGETIRGGRLDYFAILLLAKTPVAGILLLVVSGALYARHRAPRRIESFLLLAPALLVVAAFSLSSKQLGLRMVLPVIPLVAIWIAAGSPVLAAGRGWAIGTAVAVGLFTISSCWVHPNYLSYFNLASGGTDEGYKVGLGSSYDWGQDLPALAAWMERRDIDRVQLLYFGRIDPSIYGIDYVVPHRFAPGQVPLVVSASHYGIRYPVPDHGVRRNFDIPARRREIFENDLWRSERIAPSLFVFEHR
jgi:hypothetical protein